MTHTIDVDEDVFAHLQAHAVPLVDDPNAVLRRLLGIDADHADRGIVEEPSGRTRTDKGYDGLRLLFQAGRLKAGDSLVWQSRGLVQRGTITDTGAILLEDGSVHQTPSSAARHLAGYEVNGWRAWRRESDGRLLDDLRTGAENPAQPGSGG